MTKVLPPDEREARILRENGMEPKSFGITHREPDWIRLLNYKTRDIVTIHKGDRPWKNP